MECSRLIRLSSIAFLLVSKPLFASYGVSLAYGLHGSEPIGVKGIQAMLSYDPGIYRWRHFNVYFDGGASYFRVNRATENKSLYTLAIAPVVRYQFNRHYFLHPFLEISIGAAYLSKIYLQNRPLGMHFSFQDRVGIGTLLGQDERISVSLKALHYSNAHFSKCNSGFTLPIVLEMTYRFR